MKLIIYGDPRSKKNSQRIIRCGGYSRVMPSKAFEAYERDALVQIPGKAQKGLNEPLNVCCVFYMGTRRRVDLVNLQEAVLDILVHAGVIEDDCRDIVAGMDGSRVLYDKERPRVEITIDPIGEPYEAFKKER